MPSEIPSIRVLDASASFHLELLTDPIFLHADLGHVPGDELDRAERGK